MSDASSDPSYGSHVRDSLRAQVNAGRVLIGTFVTIGHPAICELVSSAGFDFVVLDMEHGSISDDIAGLIVAARPGTSVLVRVPVGEAPWIGRALDAGAAGILVPQIAGPDAARRVVDLARFPPLGNRGLGPARATGYGSQIMEYFSHANEQLLVSVQIESRQALDQLDHVASIDGIDVLFVGTGDLSVSLGVPGKLDHPAVRGAALTTLAAAQSAGRAAGVFATTEAEARYWVSVGFRFVIMAGDAEFLRRGLPRVASLRIP